MPITAVHDHLLLVDKPRPGRCWRHVAERVGGSRRRSAVERENQDVAFHIHGGHTRNYPYEIYISKISGISLIFFWDV